MDMLESEEESDDEEADEVIDTFHPDELNDADDEEEEEGEDEEDDELAAALVMSHTHWIYGTFISFNGLLIAESQSETARLSLPEATLVASIAQAGRVLGCLLSAQLTDRLGVLRVIQLGTPINLLGWPLMALTGGMTTMVAGSILLGVFVGLNAFGGRLYIAEAKLLFTDWSVARPCLLLLMQYVFDVFCGGLVLAQYAPGIFQSVVASLSAAQCSQLLAALQVCGLICSATLLRWWGRRIVLMTAGALGCTGMLIVAAFYYFEDSLSEYSWLVLLGVVLANAASSGGVSPISHVICGELLPLSIRPLFGNVLSLYLGGMSLTFLNIFPLLRSALGSHGLFAALAGQASLQ
ncbi:Facilitated trehalose transporter Tret1 [Amphibalanus amphitrite]|uniref:Facilitated trehalose transporter Tret1 n=1 Tax=Amphibalanus amphitrite TaxID=1232801 RepID=A0A6A4X4C5_AMPAM|nr:Facilitated trehalose transporter Tret1 [Amphibalanus amphitrite]